MTSDYQAIKPDFEQEKETYLELISEKTCELEDVPAERTCSRCNEIYYYIRNKEQLLKAIEDKITGEKPFRLEMLRFYEFADFAGKDTYYDWDDDNMCGCCKHHIRQNRNKKGFFQRIKERLGC
jgi:hypothetical protein